MWTWDRACLPMEYRHPLFDALTASMCTAPKQSACACASMHGCLRSWSCRCPQACMCEHMRPCVCGCVHCSVHPATLCGKRFQVGWSSCLLLSKRLASPWVPTWVEEACGDDAVYVQVLLTPAGPLELWGWAPRRSTLSNIHLRCLLFVVVCVSCPLAWRGHDSWMRFACACVC